MSKLQALLHSGDLRIAASLPDAVVLAREPQGFRVRFTESGNATFNAREGTHDDLVLALALAVFGLSRPEPVESVRVEWGASYDLFCALRASLRSFASRRRSGSV